MRKKCSILFRDKECKENKKYMISRRFKKKHDIKNKNLF